MVSQKKLFVFLNLLILTSLVLLITFEILWTNSRIGKKELIPLWTNFFGMKNKLLTRRQKISSNYHRNISPIQIVNIGNSDNFEMTKQKIPNDVKKIISMNNDAVFITTTGARKVDVWETDVRNDYTIVKNYIPANIITPQNNATITLCTQATQNYLHHIQVLCDRWDGPISLAVYAPGADFAVAVRRILYLRKCGPLCVSNNVSWHMIYDVELGPLNSELAGPYEVAKMNLYVPIHCSEGERPLDLESDTIKTKGLAYPINVARNVARLSATTHFVLSSDIELYPSLNIVSRFMRMITETHVHKRKQVYTLPVFEIEKGQKIPGTKSELSQMFRNKTAIFFHKNICDVCHSFPNRSLWFDFVPNDTDALMFIFARTKRHKPFRSWEPFYISTNDVPLFDERLTWNGKMNKMTQAYELCVLSYDFCILDNAFLIHAPGIKRWKDVMAEIKARSPYMAKNYAAYKKFLIEMKKKYYTGKC